MQLINSSGSFGMRKSVILRYLLVLILLIPVGVSAVGNINITTTPPNAYVRIDGTLLGNSNINLSSITSGTHLVTLSLSPYADYSTNLNVVDNSTISIIYTFQSSAPTISSITPASGFNNSAVSITNLAGTGFVSGATVVLALSGQSNVTGTSVTVVSGTQMTCTFDITGKPAGTWNVIVTNPDGKSVTYSGFLIKNPASTATLTSITPSSGETNTTVSITDLKGTAFASTATILLRRSSYNDIPGTVSSVNTPGTDISGSFNLNSRTPGDYQVCVYNDASTYICGLTFTITEGASTNSSIYFETNPQGATIWLNNTKVGTSTFTYYNATPGTYKVLVQKTGYNDYSGSVVVLTGKRTSFYALLRVIPTDTTVVTTATPVKTVTTIKKSTLKVPTPWPSATATPASPVDPLVTTSAAGLGLALVVLRKH